MSVKVKFTAIRIANFKCPPDKSQTFLWDATVGGLGLRVTPSGKTTYIFQGRFVGKTLRIPIGGPEYWSIPQAQEKARELQRLIDQGIDPRQQKLEQKQRNVEQVKLARKNAVKFEEVWLLYIEERRPHWGSRHYKDHLKMSAKGGQVKGNRRNGLTRPGVIAPLLSLPLKDVTQDVIEDWAAKQAPKRPARVRLALRHIKAFLNWLSEQSDWKDIVEPNVASSGKIRELVGKAKAKTDHIEKQQLSAWFAAVQQIQNPVIAAYLQCLLLTGARREELAKVRWSDVNFRWRNITITDKVEGIRIIPLTPYVAMLIERLPRRNQWVFSSGRSESGRLVEPSIAHRRACQVADLQLTLHGLRRSFASLTEWLEVPVGVVAQLMGHKPSATAEKHYRQRPLDLLRVHHEPIEKWILEQGAVAFPASSGDMLSIVGNN